MRTREIHRRGRRLHGDPRHTLRALLPYLERKLERSWRDQIENWVKEWWEVVKQRALVTAEPVNPQRVFWELSKQLPDRAILTAASGSVATWWARDLVIRDGMLASLSGNLATMGPAVPYAVAAKLAYPDRPVIASVGDGAMQMLGNSELITIAERWSLWPDPRLVVVVLNNGDLNMVTWEQRVMAGVPKFEASQDLPRFPYRPVVVECHRPLSAHCAPALHVHPAAAALRLAHIEYFFDHARMEQRVFEGFPELRDGALVIDPRRPGLGLELRPREVHCRAA